MILTMQKIRSELASREAKVWGMQMDLHHEQVKINQLRDQLVTLTPEEQQGELEVWFTRNRAR